MIWYERGSPGNAGWRLSRPAFASLFSRAVAAAAEVSSSARDVRREHQPVLGEERQQLERRESVRR